MVTQQVLSVKIRIKDLKRAEKAAKRAKMNRNQFVVTAINKAAEEQFA